MKTIATTVIAAALMAATGPVRADDIQEVREAAADGRIEFSAVTGSFTVIGHEAEEFILKGRLGDDVAELVIEGDAANWRIDLEPVQGNFQWNSGVDASELTLYVPRGSDLELDTVSGDMSLRDLSGPALDVESVSGDIELASIDAARVEIQTVSGDVAADGVTSDDSEYQSVSGDLDIRGARGKLEVQTVSGHVELDASQVSAFESETVSGNLRATLAPMPGASINLSGHNGTLELHVRVDDTPRIRAETYSGSIESDFGDVEESGFTGGETLRVDGGADAVEIEAKSFSGSVIIRRAD